MRALLALAVAGALVVPGTIATAKPAPPKPDLRTSDVVPVLSGSTLAVYATITNKGNKKAKASTAAFYLSTDATQGAGDVLVGTDAVPKLRPKRAKTIYPFLPVPSTVPAGSYRVIVCADSAHVVKETKETNNCATSPGVVTVKSTPPPPPPGGLTVEIRPVFVEISVNGDTPTDSPRTLSFVPGSQVVLTAVEEPRYPWLGDWQSPDPTKPCDGTAGSAPGYSMTFSSLQHDVTCMPNTNFTP
jgi:hypothetical protein